MRTVLGIALVVILFHPSVLEARSAGPVTERVRSLAPPRGATDNPASLSEGLSASAAATTLVLHSATFNSGATCTPQSWTSVDLTAELGPFWHADDYAGLSFGPLAGSKSLWCGTRPGAPLTCAYATLPGYGNAWNQSWCTNACLPVAGGPTADLDVSCLIRYDTEASYDYAALEYTTDCSGAAGWTAIDGGNPEWSGEASIGVSNAYAVTGSPVKVRLHFVSDGSWSDQDGLYNSDGAVHIDNLQVESLALEDFEDESVGAISSNDWQSCNDPGYGNYAGLFKGSTVLQEDGCRTTLSCLWAFIQGSTANYGCGGHPEQIAVPYGDANGRYISNEVWSPLIPLSGSGSVLNFKFLVYRDLEIVNAVYYTWRVRTVVGGCPTPWSSLTLNYGDAKDWYEHTAALAPLINFTSATHVQVALGVIDMCGFFCSIYTTGDCHSHSPLFDNVKVYRTDTVGPQWTVRDVDLFQDTFASDGTITGIARADAALDIRPSASPSIAPGDSGVVFALADPAYGSGTGTNTSGLSDDPTLSTFIGRHKTKKQAYMYVAVWPLGQPNKSGAGLSEGPGGQANRYPFSGTVLANSISWTRIRMDYTYSGTPTNPGDGDATDPIIASRFNVDLNDNLFVPGDTICFFYGATSPGGTTYYSDQWHATSNIEEVAANPMEFTILPAGGYNRGGTCLYVDGADGQGIQPYFDGAFMYLGLNDLVDRYDVRAPASGVGNRMDGRVTSVSAQLSVPYKVIFWDCGSNAVTLGDGSGNPEKTDDYALLNSFLGGLGSTGGVYLLGDDVAQALDQYTGAGAANFRLTYMPFTLVSGNHRLPPTSFSISPTIRHWPGRAFNDDFFIFGGCPQISDFDVVAASGSSLVQMSYNTASSSNGAVVSNVNGSARVLMSGFSFGYVRDDEVDGIPDRAKHIFDALAFFDKFLFVGAGPELGNQLSQNYPNPFNPVTTIAFAIKERGPVTLAIYDVGGRLVRTLANEERAAGSYQLNWDGRNGTGQSVASGVYFYRLVAPGFSQTKKMVLLK